MSSAAVDQRLGGWPRLLGRLVVGDRLTTAEAGIVMEDVLAGVVTSAQLASFLSLLSVRDVTVEELTGLAQTAVAAAVPMQGIDDTLRGRLVDTCGTGGDFSATVNVSTMTALVVATAGIPVCKHGNRAASSQTGSADVLEALGVVIDLGPDGVIACIEKANIGFCMAPLFHPGFRHAVPTRAELGIRTVFNFLGPLVNPGRVRRQVIGVSDPKMASVMLGVLQATGAERAMVVYGHDGLDEMTNTTTSTVHELRDGDVHVYDVDPLDYGFDYADPASLKGGAPSDNAERARCVLGGEGGPQSDLVALNAAAGLIVGGLAASFEEAIGAARSILEDGRAITTLDDFVQASNDAASRTP